MPACHPHEESRRRESAKPTKKSNCLAIRRADTAIRLSSEQIRAEQRCLLTLGVARPSIRSVFAWSPHPTLTALQTIAIAEWLTRPSAFSASIPTRRHRPHTTQPFLTTPETHTLAPCRAQYPCSDRQRDRLEVRLPTRPRCPRCSTASWQQDHRPISICSGSHINLRRHSMTI